MKLYVTPEDVAAITKLSELMETTGLTELTLTEDTTTLTLKRGVQTLTVAAPIAAPSHITGTVEQNHTAPAHASTGSSLHPVQKAPLVGTFYHSSNPDAAPFLKPGDTVKKGQVIGIIEAMKTMNQIEAEQDGIAKGYLTDNAAPVEFGQPLFAYEA